MDLRTYVCRPFLSQPSARGADSYEAIVGLALLASTRVLVVWSQNGLRSDEVRAGLLVATECKQKIAAYIVPGAPALPFDGIPVMRDHQSLRSFLLVW